MRQRTIRSERDVCPKAFDQVHGFLILFDSSLNSLPNIHKMSSLYDTTVPAFIRGLTALSHILTLGENYAKDNNISESDFMNARLAPDMLPLTFQIQNASNAVRNALTLVAQIDVVAFENDEKTFAELQQRISLTIEALEGTDAKAFNGAESKTVERGGKHLRAQRFWLRTRCRIFTSIFRLRMRF